MTTIKILDIYTRAYILADFDGLPVDLPMTHQRNCLNHLSNNLVDTMTPNDRFTRLVLHPY